MEKVNNGEETRKRLFSLFGVRWVYFAGVVVVAGGVMAFGFIGYYVFDFEKNGAFPMIYMILPMILVYAAAIRGALYGIEKRMHRLTEAIHAVAEGDLDYRIDLKGADEYRRVYEEFNQMVAELSRTRQEMLDFTNEFAHEFKTPITSISGFAGLLLEKGDAIEKEECREYLQLIADQSKRLSKLSQNVLLLSKVSAMQIVTDREAYDLGEQLRGCVILFLNEMEDKNISVELPEDLEISFYGNRELLEHVWLNLIGNAVKYTPRGGTITVDCEDRGEEIAVAISDTGDGMDEQTAAHIFEKYYHKDTRVSESGNGIGLSLVFRIVTLCGGSVSLESAPGEGSTFIVTLPK